MQKQKWMNSLVEIQEQNFQKEEHNVNTKKENILKIKIYNYNKIYSIYRSNYVLKEFVKL